MRREIKIEILQVSKVSQACFLRLHFPLIINLPECLEFYNLPSSFDIHQFWASFFQWQSPLNCRAFYSGEQLRQWGSQWYNNPFKCVNLSFVTDWRENEWTACLVTKVVVSQVPAHTALDMKNIPPSQSGGSWWLCLSWADTELTKPRLYLSTDNCIKLWETFFRLDSLAR